MTDLETAKLLQNLLHTLLAPNDHHQQDNETSLKNQLGPMNTVIRLDRRSDERNYAKAAKHLKKERNGQI